MRRIVLASKSPRRRELLGRFIDDFEVIEDTSEEVIEDNATPEETVKRLAEQKVCNVSKKTNADALVIGADTVVCIDAKILGKPSDKKEAFEMLKMLSGREHFVCTGFAVKDGNKIFCDAEKTAVRFKVLSDEEIEKYIASGEPLDKAGAYGIQEIGALFVEGVCGDYFNVVGLPLCRLGKVLKEEFNYDLF